MAVRNAGSTRQTKLALNKELAVAQFGKALVAEAIGAFALSFIGVLAISAAGVVGAPVVEAVMTFFLVLVVFGTAVDSRAPIAIFRRPSA
jgi:glycerol uptake facilitator-like aquaporin